VFLVLLVATVLGITFANMLSEQIGRLRMEIIARARGGSSGERMPRSRIAEVHALSSAVEFLVGEFAERTAVLGRDRDELALLVNAVSEGILQIDGDGRVVRANPAATALLGLPRHPRGQAIATLVRHFELRHLLEVAARGEAIPASEITLDEQRLLVVSRPFEEGGVRGTVVALVDLTELRRLEDVRRDFVANVSHELKTPLTSIRGYVETLLSDELPADMQRQFLDVVQKNAERLHRIVEDLLDLSRLESGGWRPELRTVVPLDVARDVWTTCAERADAKSLTFHASGDGVPVVADPGGLRQVLTNLYDNAIRHTPAGGAISVRVHRASSNGAPWAVLEVQDTGTGIPRDALARVFERFYRVDPARSRAEGGTGLGLSIVKHMVERMGGAVEAESDLGKGTTVRVRLPAALPPIEPNASKAANGI
jgi:signal transduction histidine kinase